MATQAPHHSDAQDAQLVLRAQDGDRDAFLELFRRHAQPAWRLALAVGGRADVAADAVAKGFTLTLVRLRRRTTTLAVPFRYLVTRTSGEAAASASRHSDAPVDPAPNDLAAAFLSLPEKWRAALWLTLVENGTPAQVAPIVGLSEEGTASLVDRACSGLRARYARSTPLGAYLLRDCSDAKPKLRAMAVAAPISLEADALAQWQAWQHTLAGDKRRGLATALPLAPWAERVVSTAAVAVFAAGVVVALNRDAKTASNPPMVASPVARNDAAASMTYTPAAFVSGPSASSARSSATGHTARGSSTSTPDATGAATGTASTAGSNTGSGGGSQSPSAPADTQGASTPNAGGGTSVAGTPVAVTAGTGGAGATIGTTTVGDAPQAPATGITVTADPGGGLPPIGFTLQ